MFGLSKLSCGPIRYIELDKSTDSTPFDDKTYLQLEVIVADSMRFRSYWEL